MAGNAHRSHRSGYTTLLAAALLASASLLLLGCAAVRGPGAVAGLPLAVSTSLAASTGPACSGGSTADIREEVADDFAMTANVVGIAGSGLDREVAYRRRLARLVGGNPVPFLLQQRSACSLQVGIETHFNYESSLLPRAKGVTILGVDLAGCDPSSPSPALH